MPNSPPIKLPKTDNNENTLTPKRAGRYPPAIDPISMHKNINFFIDTSYYIFEKPLKE